MTYNFPKMHDKINADLRDVPEFLHREGGGGKKKNFCKFFVYCFLM
jgi:hypothetical protein